MVDDKSWLRFEIFRRLIDSREKNTLAPAYNGDRRNEKFYGHSIAFLFPLRVVLLPRRNSTLLFWVQRWNLAAHNCNIVCMSVESERALKASEFLL